MGENLTELLPVNKEVDVLSYLIKYCGKYGGWCIQLI